MNKNSSESGNSALANDLKFYNMRQSRTLENCIKEGVTKRIHNSRKLIISKLKELNDTNHGRKKQVMMQNQILQKPRSTQAKYL